MSTAPVASCRAAIIVPSAQCPCRQISRVLAQISKRDVVIPVFNGCANSEDCIATWQGCSAVRAVDFSRRVGASRARNGGAFAAPDAEFLVFVDADDEVCEGWLDSLLAQLARDEADVAGGALLVQCGTARKVVLPDRDYWHELALFGGNLALTRAAWRASGGFDPGLRCCEDTDLAWRARGCGLRVTTAAAALVRTPRRNLWNECRQRARWGWWSVALLFRHGILDARHLPTYMEIRVHLRTTGWTNWPAAIACAQWLGQWLARLLRRQEPPSRRIDAAFP